MIENDRDRLLIGVGFALVLHAILVVVLAIVGLNTPPYPENEPVFVTLPDYEPPPEAEPEPEPEPEEISEPSEPLIPDAEIEPTAPELETQPEPSPEIRTDPAPSTPAPAQPQSGRDARPGEIASDTTGLVPAADASRDRAAGRTPDNFFAISEPDDVDSEKPSWLVEGEFSPQPESSLEEGEQRALAKKRESLPGFEQRMSELIRALENPPSSTAGSESGTATGGEEGPATATTALPGGSAIEWVGSGGRRPRGQLVLPTLTASDFGGQVPARISYLIVFEVNAAGQIVPGSLILRQSSGYTLADQKVRASISSWGFDPAPGAPPVTAIATLHITRDEIR